MLNPAEFIRAYPDKKFWTLYDSKDKKVADFSGDSADGIQEFEKFYGMLSDGKYRLCVHKSERLDRGCNSLNFTKNNAMAGTQSPANFGGHSDFLLQLVAQNAEYKVTIKYQDERLSKLEKQVEELRKAIIDLNDDDEENDESALSKLTSNFGDIAKMAGNAKSLFS
jgi:hypothetical protein